MILYGASGHAKVIKDCIEANNLILQGIFDDDDHLEVFEGLSVQHEYDADFLSIEKLIISIGENHIRKEISKKIKHEFSTIIHPSAQISNSCIIGLGCVILHNTVIQAASILGQHCILNTGATIDHDCLIQDFVHIAPGATICGNVTIGEGTLIGAGSTIIPGVRIGNWCVIGAGSVITEDITDFSLALGVPGKTVKNIDKQ